MNTKRHFHHGIVGTILMIEVFIGLRDSTGLVAGTGQIISHTF
jgi:hypothetical protein